MGGYLTPLAIRYGYTRIVQSTVGGGAIDAPFVHLSPFGMAVTPRMIQYVENASHFRISSYPTSFVKEVRIKKAFIGGSSRHRLKKLYPGFAAQKSPVGFYKSHSVSFLKCGISGARCTCFSQNDAIAPRGVRAVCSRNGSKSVRFT